VRHIKPTGDGLASCPRVTYPTCSGALASLRRSSRCSAGFRFDSGERLRVHYDIVAVIRSRDAEAARGAAIRHRTS